MKIKTTGSKTPNVEDLIYQILDFISLWEVDLNNYSQRRLERIAEVCLTLGNIKTSFNDLEDNFSLTSRQILKHINTHFGENISFSSYDDIRRKDMNILIQHEIVVCEPKNTTSPMRYSLNKDFLDTLKTHLQIK